ncbi:MAG: homoserine O-succinyltransferase [Thiohalomonadales bacterium]
MPIIAHNNLPTYQRLAAEGESVLTPERAQQQDIRELHIGLLNMMPDAALEATERQFFRLVGASNQIAQFYIHPFTLQALPRGEKQQQYITDYYESISSIKEQGLDALIITGANVSQPNLAEEPFWEPLIDIIDWAYNNVTSTLCSCLATHAVMQFRYNMKRRRLPKKQWGVFEHRVLDQSHPLVVDVNTRFDVPHSRFNEVSRQQFEKAGLKVLAESTDVGVQLAVSEDLFRLVFFQGHPEYDTVSLLKEYKREIKLFIRGQHEHYPPVPKHYFSEQLQALLCEHETQIRGAMRTQQTLPTFPEQLVAQRLDNTWHDTAEAVINNWIGSVYQLTNNDRKIPFMASIDPNDPLGIKEN